MKSQKHPKSKSFLVSLLLIFTIVLSGGLFSFAESGLAYSVVDVMNQQEGTELTVKGYIVGIPTSSNAIITSSFNSDTALAIADSPTESNTDNMIYVQVPTQFRTSFGLKSNPSLKGEVIQVTGDYLSYFSHDGIKYVTSIERSTIDNGGSTDNGGTDNGGTPDNGGTTPDNGGTTPTTTTEFDNTYYKNAIGKSGQSLKDSLHDIIDNHTVISYTAVWNGICATDEDPNNPNNVILLYTGRSQSKASKGGGVDDWNREHVWAKSRGDFGTAPGPGTDLHHLRATDVSVNATRSNYYFDEICSSAEAVRDPEATGCFYIKNREVWEPRDEVKGDVARMLFYMAVRYEAEDGVDLELNNAIIGSKNPYMGNLKVLLQWNREDKVDASEIRRNNVIYYDFQHNRNPFIDHPEWADLIWAN